MIMPSYLKFASITALAVLTATPALPSGGTWAFTGLMNNPRTMYLATYLKSGLVLAFGGQSTDGEFLKSAELFNPATGTWALTGSTTKTRLLSTSTLLANGEVLAAGGKYAFDAEIALPSAEVFDPKTGEWTETGKLNQARFEAAAVLLGNGQVLVAGGLGQCSQADCYGMASAELYDPATQKWSTTGSMNHPRIGHSLIALGDGRALVIGGTANNLAETLFGAEIFDPATGVWTDTAPMNINRVDLGAARLADGTVLATGGQIQKNFSGPLTATAEIFNPATGIWTLTGTMNEARSGISPLLLMSGRVFVVGGDTSGTSAEIFDPSTRVWTAATPALVTTGTDTSLDEVVTRLANGQVLAPGVQPQIYTPGP